MRSRNNAPRATGAACFRAPGATLALDALLARAWPEAARAARSALVRGGLVTVGGHPARQPEALASHAARAALAAEVPPGQRVEVAEGPAGIDAGPDPDVTASAWWVLVPSLPWERGVLARRRGTSSAIRFAQREARGGVAELLVRAEAGTEAGAAKTVLETAAAEEEVASPPAALASDVRRALAAAGRPVLGDALHGGILVEGGLRLRPAHGDRDDAQPAGWWPDEPVFPGDEKGAPMPVLGVSAATTRILGRGHPWILRDDDTDDPAPFAPGTRVEVCGPDGASLGVACMEGTGRLTARIFSRPDPRGDSGAVRSRGEPFDASVEARVTAALGRRSRLLSPRAGAPVTDAFRLIHGEADGLPGLFVDRLGPALRVLVTSPGTGCYRERAIDALIRTLEPCLGSDPPVVEVLHLRDRPPGELECTRLARGPRERLPAGSERLVVRERGVAFRVDLGLGDPMRSSPGVGLFLDQRDNRTQLAHFSQELGHESARQAAGGRLLNLFAHTGAFSVAWLAAGGGSAVSVDLSAAYLRWLEENLAENALAPGGHESVRQDGRRFLETLPASERFDAIVLDPPTAAAAGRRFWSVAKELPPLVERALSHLAPGGRLLVSRNDRRGGALDAIVANAAAAVRVRLARIEPALPGSDFPRLAGFPEGDAFSAVIATREAGGAGMRNDRSGRKPQSASGKRRA
jgi:23S rRNA (cytosine1962-C5)-methyltransferase